MKSCAIYPGSFDPLTLGHLDIITRASRQFDCVVVAVVRNPSKNPLFTIEERVTMIEEATSHLVNVQTDHFEGLLVDYVQKKGSLTIIKGLRALTDFEYEFQMALMNRQLAPDVETLFMMTHNKYSYLSSSMVKEVYKLDGDVSELVTPYVERCLFKKVRQND